MNNSERISQIERLQSLHLSGALSDDEFVSEKSRILGPGETPQVANEPEPSFPPRGVMTVAVVGLVVVLMVGLLAWRGNGRADQTALPDWSASGSAIATQIASTEDAVEPAPLQLAEAFELATGRRPPIHSQSDQGATATTPLRLIEAPFGKILLTKTRIADGCHACTGHIGVYYLKPEGASYAVVGKYPEAVSGWGWGEPPTEWSITNKFTTYPAIYAEGGYTGQGITCGSATLTELTPAARCPPI